MAKQIAGLCYPLTGTIDDITFYKMEGKHYARAKSSLTGKRVKTSPEFRKTMLNAGLMARASKIGAQIYKALPPGWRQFWMYRSFTGEALLLLKHNPYTDKEVKQILWKCYVEYWEQRKAIDPDNPIFQPKPQKIRKRRKYSEESIQRLIHRKNKYGKYKYPDLVKAEKERTEREAREAWAKKCAEKGQKRLAQERNAADAQLLEKAQRPTEQEALQASPAPQPATIIEFKEPAKAFSTFQPVTLSTCLPKPWARLKEPVPHPQDLTHRPTWPRLSGLMYITNNGILQTMEPSHLQTAEPSHLYSHQVYHSLFTTNHSPPLPQTQEPCNTS